MMPTKDESGNRYGKLFVVSRKPSRRKGAHWICRCDCGVFVVVAGTALRQGHHQSCGCAKGKFSHGLSRHPAYKSYTAARRRCCSNKDAHYKAYGGRGIEFRFQNFEHFWSVLGDTWFPQATLDRIDVNGHYEPSNVRWLSAAKQQENTRRTITVTIGGQTQCLKRWAEQLGKNYSTVRSRVARGWPPVVALTQDAWRGGT